MTVIAQTLTAAATGDDANILLYVVIMVVAVVLVVLLGFKDKIFKSKASGQEPTQQTPEESKKDTDRPDK